MPEKFLELATTEPVLMTAMLAIVLVGVWLGWMFKRIGVGKRVAALKNEILEAKGSIPPARIRGQRT